MKTDGDGDKTFVLNTTFNIGNVEDMQPPSFSTPIISSDLILGAAAVGSTFTGADKGNGLLKNLTRASPDTCGLMAMSKPTPKGGKFFKPVTSFNSVNKP